MKFRLQIEFEAENWIRAVHKAKGKLDWSVKPSIFEMLEVGWKLDEIKPYPVFKIDHYYPEPSVNAEEFNIKVELPKFSWYKRLWKQIQLKHMVIKFWKLTGYWIKT